MTNDNLQALSDAGVSIWLDDLSRDRLDSGNLAELVKVRNVVGVTTNPTIFQTALSKGTAYDDQLERAGRGRQERRRGGLRASRPTTSATRCDVMRAGLRRHRRGRRPGLDRGRPAAGPRHREDRSQQAKQLSAAVDRDERAHQDPGDPRGPAGHHRGARRRHQRQRHADLQPRALPRRHERLPQRAGAGARERGNDLSKIDSVASFFVSRVDTEIDKRLDAIGTDEAKALKGKAGVANARLAYQAYEEVFSTPRWKSLAADGRPRPAPALGVDGRQGPRLPGHDVRHRARRPGHRQHHAGEDARRGRRPRRGRRRHHHARTTRTPQKVLDDLEAIGVSYNDVVQVSRSRASTSSRSPGTSCSTEATEELEKAAQKAAQR